MPLCACWLAMEFFGLWTASDRWCVEGMGVAAGGMSEPLCGCSAPAVPLDAAGPSDYPSAAEEAISVLGSA